MSAEIIETNRRLSRITEEKASGRQSEKKSTRKKFAETKRTLNYKHKMQNEKLPPAPFFNPRKRLRKAVVADPNADLENQEIGWDSSFENNNHSINRKGQNWGQQHYPEQKASYSSANYSATFTSGQTRLSNPRISPGLLGESSNNMAPSRREYLGLPNNYRATSYSRTPSARPSPQGLIPMANQRTFTASNTCATNALDAKMISQHPNQNRNSDTGNNMNRNSDTGNNMMPKGCAKTYWNPQPTNQVKTRSLPQPFQPTSCRQLLGGESSNLMTAMLEADAAPDFPIFQQNGPRMERTGKTAKPVKSASAIQANKSKMAAQVNIISPVFSTTIKQLKQLYNQYQNKFNMIFEVYGVLDSAMNPNPARTGKQFILRDETDRIECVFYEIDRVLPRLIRGHWQRCIGLADKEKGKLTCVSVRPSSIEERRAVQLLSPILDHHLQTLEQASNVLEKPALYIPLNVL